MRSVGIRELKEHTSRIVRHVREQGEVVEITYRGQVVARLVPAGSSLPNGEEAQAVLADLDRLAAEIGRQWPQGVSSVGAVRDIRRDL
ncbi:MAG TPA: type II toxin-antitoxin system Phd/YefM family antitoxin [Lacipirellulaceae bacterium]|nr:type II toxin-antitoxin system Phd/YefM family antitoxin [Lacipirellulaceae bacterium]